LYCVAVPAAEAIVKTPLLNKKGALTTTSTTNTTTQYKYLFKQFNSFYEIVITVANSSNELKDKQQNTTQLNSK